MLVRVVRQGARAKGKQVTCLCNRGCALLVVRSGPHRVLLGCCWSCPLKIKLVVEPVLHRVVFDVY